MVYSSIEPMSDVFDARIGVVIPAYNVALHIEDLLAEVPGYIFNVVVVDDGSSDETREIVTRMSAQDSRITLVENGENLGVGGAVVNGFSRAIELGSDIVVKVDGDGQMSLGDLPALVLPLLMGEADFTKGCRFQNFEELSSMPLVRRVGNLGLSFMTKVATGYWSVFDSTNGFIAITREAFLKLPVKKLDNRYFFETSLLYNLALIDAVVHDVQMPARYGDETSHLSVLRTLVEFPFKLSLAACKRLFLKNIYLEFTLVGLYLTTSALLVGFGTFFGAFRWYEYYSIGVGAPTGTIMLATLPIILGTQFFVEAISQDVNSEPKDSLTARIKRYDAFEQKWTKGRLSFRKRA